MLISAAERAKTSRSATEPTRKKALRPTDASEEKCSGEIIQPTKLLDDSGRLIQAGYARRPVLTYNPESVGFLKGSALNRLRLKEWDYYGVFIGDYFLFGYNPQRRLCGARICLRRRFRKRLFRGKVVITPFGKGATCRRASDAGNARFESKRGENGFRA
jgi:hypothetical protein